MTDSVIEIEGVTRRFGDLGAAAINGARFLGLAQGLLVAGDADDLAGEPALAGGEPRRGTDQPRADDDEAIDHDSSSSAPPRALSKKMSSSCVPTETRTALGIP